jgi:SAM-dependent methyltransferase
MKDYEKRKFCASCTNENLIDLLSLGSVPLAGYFPKSNERHNVELFPLKLQFCDNCKLTQTDSVINPDILFRDYRYLSSVGLSKHFDDFAETMDKRYGLNNKKILEFGCNDGVLLEPLSRRGADAIGVDPSINVTNIARERGLNVITDYFNYDNFGTEEYSCKFDFVFGNNAFAHIIEISKTLKAIEHCLKNDGLFIFEVHYLKNLIDEIQWDNIYHEHIYYYSVTSLNNMLINYGLTIVDVEKIPIHSGSIRVTAKKTKEPLNQKVYEIIKEESKTICDENYLMNFQNKVKNHIDDFKLQIGNAKSKGMVIAGYGASGRANMFCNIVGLDNETIDFIVDESPERCNRFIPAMNIPIVDIEHLKEKNVDILIIFAWNYSKMIIEKTKFKDFKYMIAFPELRFIDSKETQNLNTL